MATINYGLPTITDNMTADMTRDHNALAVAVDEKLKEVDNKVDNIDFSSLQTQIDKKADKVHKHSITDVTDLQTTLDSKASNETVNAHLGDDTKHIQVGERENWNGKQDNLPIENRRKITFGTANPSGGVDGDIYFQYE